MNEIITKKCTLCGMEKPLSEFKKGDAKYGTSSHCRPCDSVKGHEYYVKNKEKLNITRWLYKENNREKIRARGRQYRIENNEHLKAAAKIRRRTLREDVIAGYGGKCVCCGETTYEFLSIDHINGGGGKMRREGLHPKAENFASWLIKNNFPKDFRLLCHNCNQAIGHYGICPHQRK